MFPCGSKINKSKKIYKYKNRVIIGNAPHMAHMEHIAMRMEAFMDEHLLKTIYSIYTFYWQLVKANKDITLEDYDGWSNICDKVNNHLEAFEDQLLFDFAQAICIATLKLIDKKARERDGSK